MKMIKTYIEFDKESGSVEYVCEVVNEEVKTITAHNVCVKRIGEDQVKIKCNWNTGLKKGVIFNIPDLETLLSVYKIILNEEPTWATGRPVLTKTCKIENI